MCSLVPNRFLWRTPVCSKGGEGRIEPVVGRLDAGLGDLNSSEATSRCRAHTHGLWGRCMCWRCVGQEEGCRRAQGGNEAGKLERPHLRPVAGRREGRERGRSRGEEKSARWRPQGKRALEVITEIAQGEWGPAGLPRKVMSPSLASNIWSNNEKAVHLSW